MNEEKKIQFAFGIEEDGPCVGGKFNSIDELLEYAQSSWDEMDGNPFDEDCEYRGRIYVGVVNDYEPSDFAPSLDSIADDMTDNFYSEYPIDDDADVQINNRKEAEEEWKKFVNKYFETPCGWTCTWFGVYDLKEHKWCEKYSDFDKYVKPTAQ